MTGAAHGSGALLACRVDRRRNHVRAKGLNGIDDIDVGDVDTVEHTVTLCVHFLGPVPEDVTEANVRVDGDCRAREVKVVDAVPEPAVSEDDDDCLRVVLDGPGDSSTYRLCLVEPDSYGRPGDAPLKGFDPRYHCRSFTFTANCASDLDCLVDTTCVPRPQPPVRYDYLAKDYATFRRLILDRLALLVPTWRERHVPDVAITLVELLAYVGDQLSYYQDAVATEAYLETARRRISVRRHGRLVDYLLHEGCNARAFVVVDVEDPIRWPVADVVFLTAFAGGPPPGRPLVWEELPPPDIARYRGFQALVEDPGAELRLDPTRNRIRIHTWGDRECCLPQGATSATLVNDGEVELTAGVFLAFEQVLGPRTGQPGDADPTHRHVVRLTNVEAGEDKVEGTDVLEVCWAPEDALPFPLCVSTIGPPPDCTLLADVSVARGNVVLVDEGCPVDEPLPAVPEAPPQLSCDGECAPSEDTPRTGRFALGLERSDLTFAEALPAARPSACGVPATSLMTRDPHQALPAVVLVAPMATPSSHGRWEPRPDLLASGPDDPHFVAEIDDDRQPWLRFGDNRLGAEPEPGTAFAAHYRVGNGPGGNVGAESIVHVALRGRTDSAGVRPRNPLAATGGTAPESLVEAKLTIPVAFRAVRERAVTGDDYAEVAENAGGGRLQRAMGSLVWTGSWYRADVALDPRGASAGGPHCDCQEGCGCDGSYGEADGLEGDVVAALERARRMGHDLHVETADLVAIDLELTVCVLPHYVRGLVKAALLTAFSNGELADGKPGFFHPDRWTFGDGLHVSQLLAAAQAVAGVESVEVTRLVRLGDIDRGERAAGVLAVGPSEIVLLDSEQPGPRSGRLEIVARGGR